ncbi:MAG: ABC-F family ATP-binding cassette domain-containing protein [Eggerthellaceae bacterium]|nr:ABC-F family ATP-binding cassette domain-containing protein [Eggerthellaceae bacterium]
MGVLLSAKDVSVEFPAKKVFSQVTLGVNGGDRIGIVGRNGDGKTTLLRVLAGGYAPDGGEVIPKGSPTIGVLGQADALDSRGTVRHAVVGEAPEYTWAADRKLRETVRALISDIPWEALVGELSGGQRRRVDLARLLIQDWDILMLDEPTNHLDMRAIAWLAGHLKDRWQKNAGALLVITHDRWFLDEVALSMWEVHDGVVESFEGGFSAYVQQRVERDRIAQVTEERRQNMMRKELAWLSRGARARATKPKFHLKAARELVANDPPLRDTLELRRAAITRLGKQVFELVGVTVRYGDRTVLDGIDWLVGPGDRFGILGENGTGKTTLLHILSGQLSPTAGRVKTGRTVKAVLLSQQLAELEDVAGDRVREVLGRHKTRLTVDGKSVTTAKLLERLGFAREHLQSFVRDLSGGQKRRLQLLLTLADEPNVLILDEPGNDMDTDMLAVMEDLLDTWPGTLLLVSHDRHLTERITDSQFALLDGRLRHLPGGVDEYLDILAQRAEAQGAAQDAAQAEEQAAQGRPALSGGEAYQAKKQIAAAERRMAALERQREALMRDMDAADPSDYLALGELQDRLQDTQARLTKEEDAWMELSERLDL